MRPAIPSSTPETTEKWHALTAEQVLEDLGSSLDGLAGDEPAGRLDEYGPNTLSAERGVSLAGLVLKQLRSPLIYLLIAAAVISALAEHYIDSGVIAAVIIFNTLIGVSQEWRAEKTLDALRRMAAPRARVLRDGDARVISAEDVVPGDILLLEAGDLVAADTRLLDVTELRVDESALTGESDTVGKDTDELEGSTPLADRRNMVWSSTNVTDGRGRAAVVATGMETSIGAIAGDVQTVDQMETPLQRRLSGLGLYIGVAAVVLAGLIFAIGIGRGEELYEMLLFSVAAAVSAIPEGLPAVISVVLALGVQRMVERGAIVRRLPAVETLGSTTVICSDKTGTITRNEMTVTRVWAGGRRLRVTGEGFAPDGEFTTEEGEPLGDGAPGAAELERLLSIGCIANNATLEQEDGRWRIEGNPTEGALLVASHKAGLVKCGLDREHHRIDEIPFSSKFKYMATLDKADGAATLHVKGAFERILEFSDAVLIDGEERPLGDEMRAEIEAAAALFADEALRVVAGAYRPAVDEAGMDVKMITGDHAATAAAIARKAGILEEDEEVVTGQDLEEMDDEELARRVQDIAVFARVTPTHKLRIVRALKAHDEVVAMTGDGVNDAPALKQADIGVAMGITGTEVAKEASDMVLTDDDFATIVAAVEQGRVIFGNLRRVVMFLITTNLGEIMAITAALVLGLSLPFTAIMILWVNLVTDGVSVLPLGLEPKHGDVLKQRPRPPREGILTRMMMLRVLTLSPVIAIGTLSVFNHYESTQGLLMGQTMAFMTLVAYEWWRAVSTRSMRTSIFRMNPLGNKLLIAGISLAVVLQVVVLYWGPAQQVFGTTAIGLAEWGIALAVASSVMFVDEIFKAVMRGRERRARRDSVRQ
ncbi:MAG: HAD-IC family P-type ATPase [Anaerosomatales bacterium]|nr:HAD-IC family P-type ATPase [Anaerosomatales bacterium]MDT8433868.1 HAD-IC family P-type ATPase [Anaerosomatales bacterium]